MNRLDVTQHIIMNDVTHHIPYNFHIFHYNHIHIPSSPLCFSCASKSLSTKLICDTLAMPSTMPCSAGVLCSTKLERASMLDDFRVKRLDFLRISNKLGWNHHICWVFLRKYVGLPSTILYGKQWAEIKNYGFASFTSKFAFNMSWMGCIANKYWFAQESAFPKWD